MSALLQKHKGARLTLTGAGMLGWSETAAQALRSAWTLTGPWGL